MKTVDFKELILFEDKDYILINKPAYISTLEERQDSGIVNIHALSKNYWPESQVCHRLDKETSGALAIAKNAEAYRNLAMQFEGREVNKVYHAIVEGIHEFQDKKVDLSIFNIGRTVKIDRNGKPAETFFTTLKAFKKHSLVECRPVTGRMHQIRVHLKALNAPIVGDIQYGGQPLFLSEVKKKYNLKNLTEELPLIQRVALHAFSLEFKSLNQKIIKTEAPYPKDFAVLLKQLEKYS